MALTLGGAGLTLGTGGLSGGTGIKINSSAAGTVAGSLSSTPLNLGGIQTSTGIQAGLGLGGTAQTSSLSLSNKPSTGLGLGVAQSGLLGLSSGTQSSSLGLGAKTQASTLGTGTGLAQSGSLSLGGGLGTQSGALGLGAKTQTSTLGIGTGLAQSGSLSLGGGLGTQSGALGLGAKTQTSTLGIGTGLAQSGSLSLGGGAQTGALSLGGKTQTSTLGGMPQTGTLNLTGTHTSNVGLGGSGTQTNTVGLGGAGTQASAKTQALTVMEQPLPSLLTDLVDNFSEFISKQKKTSEEISHYTDKCFRSVERDIGSHEQSVQLVSSSIHRHEQSLGLLKKEMLQEQRAAEVAQRTNEISTGLQHENAAPEEYFHMMVQSIYQRVQLFWSQLEELDVHVKAFLTANPATPSDIVSAIKTQHQPFLLMAAKLQATHEQVERLKEQYLSLRRLVCHETSDVFTDPKQLKLQSAVARPDVQTGPSPFAAASIAQATAAFAAMATTGGIPHAAPQLTAPSLSLGNGGQSLSSVGTSLGYTSISSSTAGSGQALSSSLGLSTSNKPFQLQKPPLGKKKLNS